MNTNQAFRRARELEAQASALIDRAAAHRERGDDHEADRLTQQFDDLMARARAFLRQAAESNL